MMKGRRRSARIARWDSDREGREPLGQTHESRAASKTPAFCARSSPRPASVGNDGGVSYHGRTVTSRTVRSAQSIIMNSSKSCTSSANRQSQRTLKSAEMVTLAPGAEVNVTRVNIHLKRTNRWALRRRLGKLRQRRMSHRPGQCRNRSKPPVGKSSASHRPLLSPGQ